MNIQELYLKTIFCCMACDGDIAKEEVDLIKNISSQHGVFNDMDVASVVNAYVKSINANGAKFLLQYLRELSSQDLTGDEQKNIVDFALQTIFADNKIEYSEVRFFKKIRCRLSLTDDEILASHPDVEDFLLPDIQESEELLWDNVMFENIDFSAYKK